MGGAFTFADGEEWITIGNCQYTDDMCGPLFSNPVSHGLSRFRNTNTAGLYRLVNPYGCAASPFKNYCKLSENYVVVNATDPSKLFFGDNPNAGFTTALIWAME
ncbi:hypothetical protein E7747_16335 (plasmid) [Duncaniella dubosii]|uniref:Uncharacterized protein n=1 Tax=Duncaniella dubosii TaxID=2518971 RepID=A0A4P7W741_9BACT|nr:hypothetical protein [Duncaniella dubosii]QCD43812.1 hypothetical protein E7747_16335 [Duncaniella dubosii]